MEYWGFCLLWGKDGFVLTAPSQDAYMCVLEMGGNGGEERERGTERGREGVRGRERERETERGREGEREVKGRIQL